MLMLTALSAALLLAIPQVRPAHADASSGGGDYVPLPVARIVDTQTGVGISGVAPIGAAQTKVFQVLGTGGVPSTNVASVMVTVSVHQATASTLLKLWADGTPQPVQGVVHSSTGTISNTAVVPVGDDGKVDIYNLAGTANAIVDVEGYFTSTTVSGGTGGFVPVPLTRVVDSRNNTGTTGGALAANAKRTLTLTTPGMPTNVTNIYASFAVIAATSGGYVNIEPGTATTGGPSFDFPAHTTSSGTSIRLSGGKATITNVSSNPIDFVVDVEGYFSPTATLGAGYRPADARLLDTRPGNPLAAGATMDIQVGGAGGLPVQDVAGTLLNIHTQKSITGANSIIAWPTGTTEPSTSANNNPGNTGESGATSRASLNIIQPGTDGKITIKNINTTAVDVYIDLEGWFANPLPSVPTEPNSRTVALQAAPTTGQTSGGAIDIAYTNNEGQLISGYLASPDLLNDALVDYTTLSGGDTFTGAPAMAEQTGGLLTIAGHNTDSNVWEKTSLVGLPGDWPSAWTKLGGSITSHPAVGKFSDGRLALFGVDSNGALWSQAQAAVNGAFSSWQKLATVSLSGAPVVVTNPSGVMQLFARNLSGNIVTATYSAIGSLSAWTSLGNPGTALDSTGTPSVVVGPTQIRVFVRTPAGAISTLLQSTDHTWPSTWTAIPGVVAAGPPAAALDPNNGTYAVTVRGPGNILNWASEVTRGSGTWTSWGAVLQNDVMATDPSTFTWTNSQGTQWGVIFRLSTDQNGIASFLGTQQPPLPANATTRTKTAAKAESTGTTKSPRLITLTAK